MTAKPANLQLLRNSMLFSLTRRAWSNRRQADKAKIQTTAKKERLNLTKRLIDSPELDAVTDHLNEVYSWCTGRAMPSATRRGIYFVKRDQIDAFETYLAEALAKLNSELIPAFLRTYADEKEKMRAVLGDLFDERDYPAAENIPNMFGIEWSWLELSVPDELPEEVREREVEKLRQSYLEAQDEIRQALRGGFKELLDHAVDRLTPDADGRPKIFRDSLVENFNEFFATFNARNLLDDTELAAAVSQARGVISGITPENLRDSTSLRDTVADSIGAIGKTMDGLVQKAGRKFSFDDAA